MGFKLDVDPDALHDASAFINKVGGEIEGELNALRSYANRLFTESWKDGHGMQAATAETEKLQQAGRLVREAIAGLSSKVGKAGVSYSEQDQAVKGLFPGA